QEIDNWLRRMKMRIRKRLEELGYGQIKITSSADRLMIMESMITALAQRVMEISQAVATAVPGRHKEIMEGLCEALKLRPASLARILPEDVRAGYESEYGEMDARQATVEDKFLLYFRLHQGLAAEAVNEVL